MISVRFISAMIFIVLLFRSGNILASTRIDTVHELKIKSLLAPISRSELMALVGTAALSDSMLDLVRAGKQATYLYEPVVFEGARALIEATTLQDTTTKIEIYLPYIGRAGTRLTVPFSLSDFVQGSLEDYNQLERRVEEELGIRPCLPAPRSNI